MDRLVKYGTPVLLLVFVAWYGYRDSKKDAEFKEKIEQIDQVRKALLDTVANLQRLTTQRDEKLREAIGQNTEILDTLNSCLDKVNKNTRIIDNRIKDNQKNIDELWKNN